MSKGAGWLMVKTLEIVGRGGIYTTAYLAEEVYGREATRSEVVSLRRALHSLKKSGRVATLGRGWGHGQQTWATPEKKEKFYVDLRRLPDGRNPGEEKTEALKCAVQ